MAIPGGPEFMTDPRRGCGPAQPIDPDWWFSDVDKYRDRAKRICRRCPVRLACDAWATERNERWGVWGGRLRGRNSDAANRARNEARAARRAELDAS
jgi:hypothetical protein